MVDAQKRRTPKLDNPENEQREKWSDHKSSPLVWYVYILEFDDGSYYIGQTNDLTVRLAEHALGNGAEATKEKAHKLVWFNQCADRDSAKHMETRLKKANAKRISGMISNFDQLVRLVKPDKTLDELERERRDYISKMGGLYHHNNRNFLYPYVPAACGWDGGPKNKLFGTPDWQELVEIAETYDAVEKVAGEDAARRAVRGFPPCGKCLALRPLDDASPNHP